MNYMPEVLEMLGVEVNMHFNIIGGVYNPVYFNDEYVLIDKDGHDETSIYYLKSFLNGELEIEKIPWKPKDGEKYWCVISDGDKVDVPWCGYSRDFYSYNAGNCFKTKEEITPEIKQRVLYEMKGKYEND